MELYSTEYNKSKNLILLEDGKRVAELIYNNWYSTNARAYTDLQEFSITRQSSWKSTTTLHTKHRTYFQLDIQYLPTTEAIIMVFNKRTNEEYRVKRKSILKNNYGLYDSHGEKVARIKARQNWKNLKYDFKIKVTDEFDRIEDKNLFLLFLVYAIGRLLNQKNSGAV